MFTLESLRLGLQLAKRDIALTYSRSWLGVSWLFFNPIAALVIYSTIYGRMLRLGWVDPVTGENLGFILPFFCGFIPHILFSESVTSSLSAIVSKRSMVVATRIPLQSYIFSSLFRSAIGSVVQFILLMGTIVYYDRFYAHTIPMLLTSFVLLFLLVIPLSISLALLSPFVSDLGDVARIVLRFSFYLAPIAYPITIASGKFQKILFLNPLTTVIESFRSSIMSVVDIRGPWLTPFAVSTIVLWILAIYLFKKLSGAVTDVL